MDTEESFWKGFRNTSWLSWLRKISQRMKGNWKRRLRNYWVRVPSWERWGRFKWLKVWGELMKIPANQSLSTQMKCSPEETLEMSLREHFCLPRPQRWMRESWITGGVVMEGERWPLWLNKLSESYLVPDPLFKRSLYQMQRLKTYIFGRIKLKEHSPEMFGWSRSSRYPWTSIIWW